MFKKTRRMKTTFLLIFPLSILSILLLLRMIPIHEPTTNVPVQPAKETELVEIKVNQVNVEPFLLLVNSQYPLPNEDTDFTTIPAYPTVAVSTTDVRLYPNALEAVANLFRDAKQMGYENFYINSGYRTYEKQNLLYKNATDKAYVQKPGASEHHTGLAVDIADTGGKDLGKSRKGKWLAENAWKYGFLLRYPEDKREVTGIAYEPWHFRYVGFPHAFYCHENNLCLEEYVQNLKNKGGYEVILNSTSYSVFYEEAKHGIIHVPKDLEYTVSSDNTGGYVVTVKDAPLVQNARE